MARLPSVVPRHNPYRENPSGLAIAAVVTLLAGGGGAAWYFLVHKKKGGGVGLEDLDQSLVSQLTEEQKKQVLEYFPNIAAMIASSKGEDPKQAIARRKNEVVRNLLQPMVVVWDKSTNSLATGEHKRVSPAEAQALVDAGTHQWNTGPLREFVTEIKPADAPAAKSAGAKPAAKKPAKKKGKKK